MYGYMFLELRGKVENIFVVNLVGLFTFYVLDRWPGESLYPKVNLYPCPECSLNTIMYSEMFNSAGEVVNKIRVGP